MLEEYLDGPEVSLFCVSDGTRVLPLAPAQDFKRALDGDDLDVHFGHVTPPFVLE